MKVRPVYTGMLSLSRKGKGKLIQAIFVEKMTKE